MKPNEVKDLIRGAQRNNVTLLDLSSNNLTSLPPEILELKSLTKLYISNNHLTSLPSEISELKNLTELYISNNHTSLPPEISELKNLTKLYISNNQLTSLPPEISKLKNLTKLYISNNQLTSLPPEISELKNLTELYISNNQLTSLPPEISELKNLTKLSISNNQLISLPSEISKLIKLTELYLYNNQLTSLPPEISELKNLTELYLYNNQLVSLPPEISKLKNLTELYLYNNQLTSLPSEITEIIKLTKLSIRGNQLNLLPSEISKLKNLTTLNMSGNQLVSLPPEISKLKNLTTLNMSGNQLISLLPEVFELNNLMRLNISGNQLTSLPPEISELRNLHELDVSGNLLISLPPGISELRNLHRLDVSGNLLISLPPEILKLYLEFEWENRWQSDIIYLNETPIEKPPVEIMRKGREAVLNYINSVGNDKKLNEVKVLLVGEGGAGKTSLVKRLFGEEFDGNEPQTHGINIRKWVVENGEREIKANFWDFGGQEIMHATHQFFLSKRSLYILVLDGRKDEKPEYWLKLIENFGGDSPVLVVINKIDENPGFELDRKFLLEKYPSIRGFYRLSCKSNEGLEKFSKTLNEDLKAVKHLEIKWPKSWFNVKSKLEKMRPSCKPDIEGEGACEHCNFIQYEDYKVICCEEGISGESEQNTLVDFLHDLGVILHFRDIPLLNTHVLEPEWVTNAVYRAVNSKEVGDSRGVLKIDMFPEILKQNSENDFYYPVEQYGFIVSLMKKFELSYDLDDRTVLLPSLLEIQRPDFEFDYKGALKFIIDYDFLPPSVMPRFIVKMHRDIKDDLRWRTGVVMEDRNFSSSAVVRVDKEARRINIYVDGEQKKEYLAVIRHKFMEINNSFEKLKATEKIPLPDRLDVTVTYEHLTKLERKGIEMYMPDGSDHEYMVSDLLGTVINRNSERMLLEEIYRNTENSKTKEKEIIEILQNLQEIDTGSDNEDTLIEKLGGVVSVSPAPGVSLDLGEMVRLYLKWKRKRS